ncbi:MAG: uncharacterized protein KVP18_004654 [Porospora cf. gigantea A]|uniref:uncharacterized protein n=2 Tax=Porospora cf. gigantea A TaxID=2853593 RepID=UPI0035596DF8|nr:MAG: hypothetical protein KVP18_004654 [Porospora cf. gigantea A]
MLVLILSENMFMQTIPQNTHIFMRLDTRFLSNSQYLRYAALASLTGQASTMHERRATRRITGDEAPPEAEGTLEGATSPPYPEHSVWDTVSDIPLHLDRAKSCISLSTVRSSIVPLSNIPASTKELFDLTGVPPPKRSLWGDIGRLLTLRSADTPVNSQQLSCLVARVVGTIQRCVHWVHDILLIDEGENSAWSHHVTASCPGMFDLIWGRKSIESMPLAALTNMLLGELDQHSCPGVYTIDPLAQECLDHAPYVWRLLDLSKAPKRVQQQLASAVAHLKRRYDSQLGPVITTDALANQCHLIVEDAVRALSIFTMEDIGRCPKELWTLFRVLVALHIEYHLRRTLLVCQDSAAALNASDVSVLRLLPERVNRDVGDKGMLATSIRDGLQLPKDFASAVVEHLLWPDARIPFAPEATFGSVLALHPTSTNSHRSYCDLRARVDMNGRMFRSSPPSLQLLNSLLPLAGADYDERFSIGTELLGQLIHRAIAASTSHLAEAEAFSDGLFSWKLGARWTAPFIDSKCPVCWTDWTVEQTRAMSVYRKQWTEPQMTDRPKFARLAKASLSSSSCGHVLHRSCETALCPVCRSEWIA